MAETTALTPVGRRNAALASLRGLLEGKKQSIAQALPKHMNPDRMVKLALSAAIQNPKLLECTPESVLFSVIRLAEIGLEPNGMLGTAYLIPRRNSRKGILECNAQIGYVGWVQLAYRSDKVASIHANVVREGDQWDYREGLDPVLVHVPAGDDEKPITHAYAVGHMTHGGRPAFVVINRRQIEAARAVSSRTGSDGPWQTNYPEMAMKTAILRLAKVLPKTSEDALARASEIEARAAGEDDVIDVLDVDNGAAPEEKKPATAALKDRLRERHVEVAEAQPAPAPAPEREPGSEG